MKPEDLILAWTKPPFSEPVQKEAEAALSAFRNGETSALTDAFSLPLEFGTGGIRGKMGSGVGRMNEFTVGRAALGFARHLAQKKKAKIVIAYDSRHRSKEFAEVTAGIFAGLGISVKIFPKVTPTPLLSYAIRYYKAQGGVVITASHNPSEYNGFKAYLADGGQLVPPDDKEIIQKIEAISDWTEIKLLPTTSPIYKDKVSTVKKHCFRSYLKDLKNAKIQSKAKKSDRKKLKIVYSPLHGTGAEFMKETLRKFGYKNLFLVKEQAEPNGDFPTVKFPNPEEKDALVLCEKYAKKHKAQLFIATDPDADRLGVGIRKAEGEYEYLNGNQIGSIMAAFLAEKVSKQSTKTKHHIIKTIVTTDLQESIAKKNGIEIKNVLTGFKYIAEEMKTLDSKKGERFLFGGEESYGYLPVQFVRDKDSLASALLFAEILAEKKDILDYLTQIYMDYGLYRESLISLTLEGSLGQAKIKESIEKLRNSNLIGSKIGKRTIEGILDFGTQTAKGIGLSSAFDGLPTSNVIQVLLSGYGKLTIRPSGTEPKVKIYSSFCSLEAPTKKSDIPRLWNDLGEELSLAENEFAKLAGLK